VRPTKPDIDAATAEAWAKDAYGIQAQATPLPGEVDRNFYLCGAGNHRYVFKISPIGVLPEIEGQIAVLTHLETTDVRDITPRIVRGIHGEELVEVESSTGDRFLTRITEFFEGVELAQCSADTTNLWHQLGTALGRLDVALQTFDHPSTRRHSVWDLARVLELEPLLDAVAPEHRPFVKTGLDRFRERVLPHLDQLRRSVIHNDANDYNVLVHESGPNDAELAGIIDFGDMLHTITVAELAIACAYSMLDRSDPWLVASRLTEGYEIQNALTPVERGLLPDLIVGRLCNSLLMSAQARLASPDDEYLTISERPAAALLKRLIMNPHPRSTDDILAIRHRHLGRNLSVSYREPLKIVRGEGACLFDHQGNRFLDLVNNVCHVGHCHPRVVEAGQRQMEMLNTNSRYLHDALTEYVVRLTAAMPDRLSVCFLVCTGTEANDLALRLARAHSRRREILVLDHAYHGHSPSLVEISAYKCEGPGGEGLAEHANKLPCPDVYRGKYRGPDAGTDYVAEVQSAIERLRSSGRTPGAFMAESLLGCGGQIILPNGFLGGAHAAMREAGGVCIADEVQVGFGRVGTHMWAFESMGGTPDIVTMGKPIGNGHPLAAVVTTPEIAASFDTGMEYFNTFGGNPVSCAIGLAVLDVIETEDLQSHALAMGERMKRGLDELTDRHELIGDVRGQGLFLGVELVSDRESRHPAGHEADETVEHMKTLGFLLSTDGPDHNVIKIKPPLVLTAEDVDATIQAFDESLSLVGGER